MRQKKAQHTKLSRSAIEFVGAIDHSGYHFGELKKPRAGTCEESGANVSEAREIVAHHVLACEGPGKIGARFTMSQIPSSVFYSKIGLHAPLASGECARENHSWDFTAASKIESVRRHSYGNCFAISSRIFSRQDTLAFDPRPFLSSSSRTLSTSAERTIKCQFREKLVSSL